MNNTRRSRKAKMAAVLLLAGGACFCAEAIWGQPGDQAPGEQGLGSNYKVLSPSTQGNLTVFPVVAAKTFDTHNFLTLDEGIRSGAVVVTEQGAATGLVRPRRPNPVIPWIWDEHPLPPPVVYRSSSGAVNQLVLINNSDRPLLLLVGEIVTGGKQDRVVGKDRIVPTHGEPISLDVFCVEPHRWTATSTEFGALHFSMAQPSVRQKALFAKDQQAVWNAVAESKGTMTAAMAGPVAQQLDGTSSYAKTMENRAVQDKVDALAAPIQQSYEKLMGDLRAAKAVGAVVAVNGEIVWADLFASSSLLEKYWPKLIRSYAAEALSARVVPLKTPGAPGQNEAEAFLHNLTARRESVETEPGIYRNTELVGPGFDAFVLTSLLPGTGYAVHVAKMKQ